jgi:hypothetical protein
MPDLGPALSFPFDLSAPRLLSDELYQSLGPWQREDEKNPARPLLALTQALGGMLQDIDDLIRDDDGGPGWSSIMDATRSPSADWLFWLQQFYGARIPPGRLAGEDDTTYRERIRTSLLNSHANYPGTRAALDEVVTRHMTGSPPEYFIIERYTGSAWKTHISTRASQTPNPTLTEADIRKQKPVGIVLTYSTYTGGDFDTLRDTHSDFNDVTASFTDFNDIVSDPTQT